MENNTYQTYFDSMPCYITVQNRDLQVIDANKKFVNDFGEYEGRYCYQVYKNRPEKCEICHVERTFRDGLPHHGEELVRTNENKEIWVLINTTPIYDDNGKISAANIPG